MKTIIFTKKLSRVGKSKQLLIYIPKVLADLLAFGMKYKITIETVDE